MFIQIDEELHNVASIDKFCFSEHPNYEGEWRAEAYFFGDAEAYSALPHTFPSEAEAREYVGAAITRAGVAHICTEDDLITIAGRIDARRSNCR